MIRILTVTRATFACLVAFAIAQDREPAPKKQPPAQKKDADGPDAKKDDAKKDDPDAEKPKPREDPKEIIKQLNKDFDEVQEKLKDKDTGEGTRKTQKSILDGIDKLLDQNDDDNKGGGGGGGASGQSGNSGQGGGASGQNGGASGQNGGASGQNGGGSQGNGQQKKNDPMLNDDQKNGGQGDKKKDDKDQAKNEGLKDKKNEGGGKGDAKKDDPGGGKGASGTAGQGSDTKKPFTPGDLKKDIWGHLPEHRRKEMEAFARERALPQYEEMIRAYYNSISESARRKDGD